MESIFGAMYEDDYDDSGFLLPAHQTRARNCAEAIEPPPEPRNASNFTGIKNQGATCYLNSLIQCCFMTPELRKAILSLPLCVGNPETPSDMILPGARRTMLFCLQQLFVRMQEEDMRDISTKELTDSFGWEDEDVRIQQDYQEANRVLFEAIERSLSETEYCNLIDLLYRGTFSNELECSNCLTNRVREETFSDIIVQVKGFKSLQESLNAYTAPDYLTEGNKYACEICDSLQDAKKVTLIAKVPDILVISLNRFEYDMYSGERKKVTDKFTFPIELDMERYCAEAGEYQLFAVAVHQGNAYSGHYYAYIRDLVGEGKWVPGKEEKKNRKIKAQDPELLKGWFCFNDSTVTSVDADELASLFSGQSCAYILFYRSKRLQVQGKPQIPDYWVQRIQEFSDTWKSERLRYEELKSYIEVILQPQSLFKIESGVVQYVSNEVTYEQGVTFRLNVNEMGQALLDKALELDDGDYELVEALKLSNGYVQLLKKLNTEVSIKDQDVSHKSCWIMIPKAGNDDQWTDVLQYIGENAEPIQLNLQVFGEKTMLVCNKAWNLQRLREMIQGITGILPEEQCLTVTNGKVIKENDKPLFEQNVSNGLQVLLTIQEAEEVNDAIPQFDGEEDNTIVVNDEDDPENFHQKQIELTWNLTQLSDFLRQEFQIAPEQPIRLRKLNGNTLFFREEYHTKLTRLGFAEGGFRIMIERGEPPMQGQIVLRLTDNNSEHFTDVFIPPDSNIETLKKAANEVIGKEVKLYTLDWQLDPVILLKEPKHKLQKYNVRDGDVLLWRDLDALESCETVVVTIFIPLSSETSQMVEELKVSQYITLTELRNQIAALPTIFNPDKGPEFLRLRDRNRSGLPGKVHRDYNQILQRLNFGNHADVIVETLDEPENLTVHAMLIGICERQPEKYDRTPIEYKIFDYGPSPNLDHLYHWALSSLNKPWPIQEVSIAKFKPQQFAWEIVQDQREPAEKGCLLDVMQAEKNASGIFNLKRKPVLIKDGECFMLKYTPVPDDDDFRCRTDEEAKRLYKERKKQNAAIQQQNRGPERGVVIKV